MNDTLCQPTFEKASLKTAVLHLPPCKVCGGKASGIHYGVNSCEACKGFFRRYLIRKEPYVCQANKECTISDRPRGNCSACRMQKCLDLGMSKNAVRQGRYTLSERTQTIIEVNKFKNKHQDEQRQSNFITESASQRSPQHNHTKLESENSFITNPIKEKTQQGDILVKDPLISPQVFQPEKTFNPFASKKTVYTDTSIHDFNPSMSPTVTNLNTTSLGNIASSPDSGIESQSEGVTTDDIGNEIAEPNSIMSHFILQLREECESIEASLNRPTSQELSLTALKELTDEGIENVLRDIVPKMIRNFENLQPPSHCHCTDKELEDVFTEAFDNYAQKLQVFGQLKPLPTEEHNRIYEATGLDVDGRLEMMEQCRYLYDSGMRNMVQFVQHIPHFKELPLEDQCALFKASVYEFDMISNHRFINEDKEMIICPNGIVYHFDEINFWNDKEYFKEMLKYSRMLKKLELTKEEMVIVVAICVTFNDRCKLLQPDKVEDIQLFLLSFLRFLLRKHYGKEEPKAFARVMSLFSQFRELTEKISVGNQELRKDRVILKACPELKEFL